MSIEIRKKNIARLAKRFRCKKITNLALEVKLPKNLFENICIATKTYVAKCIDSQNVILNEKKLLKKFLSKKKFIKNITPNGIIVPKTEVALEFNLLIKSYVDIIKFLNIENLITNFHFPPNLRVKFAKINQNNINRKHPTETMHADTWTGANPNWLAVHLFILGDIKNNHIRYAQPPKKPEMEDEQDHYPPYICYLLTDKNGEERLSILYSKWYNEYDPIYMGGPLLIPLGNSGASVGREPMWQTPGDIRNRLCHTSSNASCHKP